MFLNLISTGASDDFNKATQTARAMVARFAESVQVSAVVLRGVPRPQNDPYGAVYLAQVPVRWIAGENMMLPTSITRCSGSMRM